MDDITFILIGCWALASIVYTLSAICFDLFTECTQRILRLTIDCKSLNIIGKITFIPTYTLLVIILLAPSILLYALLRLTRFIFHILSHIFQSVFFNVKEDNND